MWLSTWICLELLHFPSKSHLHRLAIRIMSRDYSKFVFLISLWLYKCYVLTIIIMVRIHLFNSLKFAMSEVNVEVEVVYLLKYHRQWTWCILLPLWWMIDLYYKMVMTKMIPNYNITLQNKHYNHSHSAHLVKRDDVQQ